jgi:hypothetical protein
MLHFREQSRNDLVTVNSIISELDVNIQGDSRSAFVRKFLISQNHINTKISSRLLQVQIKYFQNGNASGNIGNRRHLCFFKWKDPILISHLDSTLNFEFRTSFC